MDALLAVIALLAIAACLAVVASYRLALRRMSRFLDERDPTSNLRMTADSVLPGTTDLVGAIDRELERSATTARVQALSEREFIQDLASLSHDIRTPLAGAKGYLQLAAEEQEEDQRNRYLQAAEDRLDDMQVLLDQLLEFARSSDDPAFDKEQVNVLDLLAAVLAAKHPEFQARGKDAEVSLGSDPLMAEVASDALRRIFENIIDNGLIHGEGGIIIHRDAMSLTFSNRLRAGEHPDPERIFERFHREDAARNRTGSGLGLAVVRNLAEPQGIEVWATVTESVFTLHMRFR